MHATRFWATESDGVQKSPQGAVGGTESREARPALFAALRSRGSLSA